tara:strand:- start:11732 stop:12397 length:666 start_codon:yes stop_codon:yes gene_type:complete
MLISGAVFAESLESQLAKKRQGSKAPPQAKSVMQEATQKLQASGLAKKAVIRGKKAPDFNLESFKGGNFRLKDALKKGPVVVTFYRGGWCPYCNLQLKAYEARYQDFIKAGATIIAISPELPENAKATADANKVSFNLLYDKDNKVAKRFGLVFDVGEDLQKIYKSFGIDLDKSQGNDKWQLPLAATYVIAKDSTVVYSFVEADYTKRAEPQVLIDLLNRL